MKISRRTELPSPAFTVAQARIGEDLKMMFDALTAGPMPDRLVHLAQALEEALKRGELNPDPSPRLN